MKPQRCESSAPASSAVSYFLNILRVAVDNKKHYAVVNLECCKTPNNFKKKGKKIAATVLGFRKPGLEVILEPISRYLDINLTIPTIVILHLRARG